jgi:hypothetical protein
MTMGDWTTARCPVMSRDLSRNGWPFHPGDEVSSRNPERCCLANIGREQAPVTRRSEWSRCASASTCSWTQGAVLVDALLPGKCR